MDELAEQKYGVVLANIVADVIIPLSAKVERFSRHGGMFLARASSTPVPTRWRPPWNAMACVLTNRWEKKGWVALAARMK